MEKNFEQAYLEQEERHWWNRARRAVILEFLKNSPRDAAILEIGCASGALISNLLKDGFTKIVGIDISQKAVDVCQNRGLKNVFLMDGSKPRFESSRFDIIVASDVLEHLASDRQAIAAWTELLNPGGKIICFVPAFQFLWSGHDAANRHWRRYAKKNLIRLLENQGLVIVRASYWNFLLFPLALIRASLSTLAHKQEAEFQKPGKLVNALLFGILTLENYYLKIGSFPFGISVFAVARKNRQ